MTTTALIPPLFTIVFCNSLPFFHQPRFSCSHTYSFQNIHRLKHQLNVVQTRSTPRPLRSVWESPSRATRRKTSIKVLSARLSLVRNAFSCLCLLVFLCFKPSFVLVVASLQGVGDLTCGPNFLEAAIEEPKV